VFTDLGCIVVHAMPPCGFPGEIIVEDPLAGVAGSRQRIREPISMLDAAEPEPIAFQCGISSGCAGITKGA